MKFIKAKETFIMYFLVSVDSNIEANLATVLSTVSGYCMCCFFRKPFLKSDTAIEERYIYNSMCITCIIIYIYDEYFC